jgi:hypothetical protein
MPLKFNQTAVTPPSVDPDLPNATALMAALLAVTTRYASNPSVDLAELALQLSSTLTTAHYAESPLIQDVAQRVHAQWHEVLHAHEELFARVVPASTHIQ